MKKVMYNVQAMLEALRLAKETETRARVSKLLRENKIPSIKDLCDLANENNMKVDDFLVYEIEGE